MKNFVFFLLLAFSFKAFAQTTIVLRPGPGESKDAEIWSLSPTTSLGNWPEIKQNAWTWSGDPGIERGLVQFDLSQIPTNAVIQSAYLSLYGIDSPSTEYDYHQHGEGNAVWVQRITSAWDAATVAWDSRPSRTLEDEASIPKSSSGYENYLDVDVTKMVSWMVANPSSKYGFMLKLKKEQTFRRMTFASSDCGDPGRYPSLTITYTVSDLAEETKVQTGDKSNISVYPNPFDRMLNISSTDIQDNSLINLYTLSGQLVFSTRGIRGLIGNVQLDLGELPSQTYLLEIISDKQIQHSEIVKN